MGGTTITVDGAEAFYPAGGRYSSTGIIGTDSFATIAAPPANNDFFFRLDAADLPSVDTAVFQYAAVTYSFSADMVGDATTNALWLNTSDQSNGFVSMLNRGVIDRTAGTHTLVLDMQNSTDLDGATAGDQFSGNLTGFRWDFFNAAGNDGTTFTLESVTFGTEITAVPEPTSLAFLALVGSGVVVCRRKRSR